LAAGVDNATFKVATYHCGFGGCTVRYAPERGYFTIVKAPDLPVFVEEPAVNTLQCAIHNTWRYRSTKSDGSGFEWCCGCEGCDYCHLDVPGNWLCQLPATPNQRPPSETRYAGLVYCLRIASRICARLSLAERWPEFSISATSSAIAPSLMTSRSQAE
jgi:hypothetical protein